MGRSKEASEKDSLRPIRPALTPEARENQLIFLATEQAEKQLRDGTASSQIICHYLKLGTQKAKLECEKLKAENELLAAKKEHLESAKRTEEMFAEAIRVFSKYRGREEEGDDENYEYYEEGLE